MHLPYLKSRKQTTQKQIVAFRGVNYSEAVQDGQFEDCRNLSSQLFPCLSQRQGRERGKTYENATAVHYKNGLIVVDGTDLIHNGEKVGTVSPGKKHIVDINTKVVIFPDKVMYDTSTKKLQSLGAELTTVANSLEFANGKSLKVHMGAYRAEVVSSGNYGGTQNDCNIFYVPEDNYAWNPVFDYRLSGVSVNSENGQISFGSQETGLRAWRWNVGDLFVCKAIGIDGVTSWGRITKVYQRSYSESHRPSPSAPAQTETYYCKGFDYDRYEVVGTSYGAFAGFEAANFKTGDTVEISGCTTYPDNNGTFTIREIFEEENPAGTLYGLTFDAEAFANGTEAGEVTIQRKVPNLKVLCEQDNRIFGAEGNTIYVSALGDPTNFYTFDGVDTDSYQVAVATEGEFTGCIGYGSSVLFFKEDCMHKLMGSYPSEYTLFDYTIPGVLNGSEASLRNINEAIYYHGREGVYRYTGGTPELITAEFGLRRFDTASAGAQGDRYYISMRDKRKNEWGLWVYDILRDIWLREDDTQAISFARDGGKLYYIDGTAGDLVLSNPDSSEESVAWSATFCRMDEMYHNRKCYSKLLLRGELLEDSAWLQVDISCDGEPFKRVYTSRDKAAKTLAIPIMPKRCDNFRIRLSGEGKCIIRSMVREFGIGSEY